MQSENIAITAELGRLTEELSELRAGATELKEAGDKLTQERDSLELGLGQLRADCDRYIATLGERTNELDAAHAKLAEVQAENKTLNEQRSFVDSCIKDQSDQIKQLKARAKESPENVQQFTMLLDVIRDGDRERDALKAEIANLLDKQRKNVDTVAALRLQNKIYHDDFMSERRERQRVQDHTKFDHSSPATKSASNELQKFIFGADTVVDGPYKYLQCPKCKAIFDQADLSKFDEHIARCI